MFNGKTGIGINEWIEEVQACIRACHLSVVDQAHIIFDNLERPVRKKNIDPLWRGGILQIFFAILKELFGCVQSYVTLQEAFFSRGQQERETLLEFSCAPEGSHNIEILLRDQFVEHVLDSSLCQELKQLVRRQSTATLLVVRAAGICWEREGFPGVSRECSYSLQSMHGLQYGVKGTSWPAPSLRDPQLGELKELLKCQQEQLHLLTHTVASNAILYVIVSSVP